MAKGSNQKLKILYILDYLTQYTDEENMVTVKDIISYLEKNGISAERKSIYSDIEELSLYGVDIISENRGKMYYYIASRTFELAELKMLVDSVQASRFITESKCNKIISKIETLTSKNLAAELQRQVYIADRAKTQNEKIYYVVDSVNEAIHKHKKIAFNYYEYNVNKERIARNNGNKYIVSPYSLTVSDDNYYMIAHYPKYNGLSHFRIDRMENVEIMNEPVCDIKSITDEKFDLGLYSKTVFQMYAGKTERVTLVCDNSIVNAVIDKFGEDVMIVKNDEKTFKAGINVKVSPTFFAWVFTFSGKMKIISPQNVLKEFNNMVNSFNV